MIRCTVSCQCFIVINSCREGFPLRRCTTPSSTPTAVGSKKSLLSCFTIAHSRVSANSRVCLFLSSKHCTFMQANQSGISICTAMQCTLFCTPPPSGRGTISNTQAMATGIILTSVCVCACVCVCVRACDCGWAHAYVHVVCGLLHILRECAHCYALA